MKFPPVEQRVEKHLRYYLNMEKRETWDEIKRKPVSYTHLDGYKRQA